MIPPFPIEEYELIEESSISSLNRKVNQLSEAGWVLWGSPTSCSTQYTQYHAQAMIKFKQPLSRFVDENHPPDESFPPEHFQL